MRDVLDLHTHTIASGHAYNTMMEMIHEAQNLSLIHIFGIRIFADGDRAGAKR